MKVENWELKNYYSSIRMQMLCSAGVKKRILADLKEQIADYLEEEPNADMQMLQNRFGTPHQIAAAALEEMPAPEVLEKLRLRKKLIAIIGFALLAAIVIWLGAVIIAVILDYGRGGGYIETGPIIVE